MGRLLGTTTKSESTSTSGRLLRQSGSTKDNSIPSPYSSPEVTKAVDQVTASVQEPSLLKRFWNGLRDAIIPQSSFQPTEQAFNEAQQQKITKIDPHALQAKLITGPTQEEINAKHQNLLKLKDNLDTKDQNSIDEFNAHIDDFNQSVDQFDQAQNVKRAITPDNFIPIGQEIKAPFINAGITVPSGDGIGTGYSFLKGFIEAPERLLRSFGQVVGIKPPDENKVQYKVPTYQETAGKTVNELIDQGFTPAQAVIFGSLTTAGQFAGDALIFTGPLSKGYIASKAGLTVPSESHVTAWDFLGRPKTIEEARSNFLKIQKEFHPDISGSDAISKQANNAMDILKKEGIPTQSRINKGINNILNKDVKDIFGSKSAVQETESVIKPKVVEAPTPKDIENIAQNVREGKSIQTGPEIKIPSQGIEEIASQIKKQSTAKESEISNKISSKLAEEAKQYKTKEEFIKAKSIEKNVDDIQDSYEPNSESEKQVINQMESDLKKGANFPPIILDEKGNVVDGLHRLEAYRQAGIDKIPTITELQKKDLTKIYNESQKESTPEGRTTLPEVPAQPERVTKYADRLKLRGVDPVLVNAIITPSGKRAFGVSVGGKIGLEKVVQQFTEDHEIFHQIFSNFQDMRLFKNFDKEALLSEAKDLYGDLAPAQLEEEMAKDFQQYVNDRESGKESTFFGKLKEFFERLYASFKRLFKNENDIKEFYRTVYEGKAKEETNIPQDERLQRFIDEAKTSGTLDFRKEQYALGKFLEKTPLDEVFNDEGDLTLKTLTKLKGRSTVSKQFIEDLTNSGDIKQVERDLIRSILTNEPDEVNVPEFAERVRDELLPLERFDLGANKYGAKYENISLPADIRGDVAMYKENIYKSPIETSAGDIHFMSMNRDMNKGYFGHTRIEDMAEGDLIKGEPYNPPEGYVRAVGKGGHIYKTGTLRRVIEVQSDLYQKGKLEYEGAQAREIKSNPTYAPENRENFTNPEAHDMINQQADERLKAVARLEQYNNPSAHFRMVREEVRQAAKDGKTKLQFPTGETAMKIEGLGQGDNHWAYTDRSGKYVEDFYLNDAIKQGDKSVVGMEARRVFGPNDWTSTDGEEWVITNVLSDGKFKAVPKNIWEGESHGGQIFDNYQETFDISGKVDINNPIYRFYEKDLGRYLKNNFGAVPVTDDKGVTWMEVPVDKEYADLPVPAFNEKPEDISFSEILNDFKGLKEILPEFKDGKEFSKLYEFASRYGKTDEFSDRENILINKIIDKKIDSINFTKLGNMVGQNFQDQFGNDFYEFWKNNNTTFLKNPVFDSGDRLEDVKKTLAHAEGRVGAKPVDLGIEKDVIPEPKDPINEGTVKIYGETVPLPEDIYQEKMQLQFKQEAIEASPLNELKKYVDPKTGELPEPGVGYEGKFPNAPKNVFKAKGDEILGANEFMQFSEGEQHIDSNVVREKFAEHQQDIKDLKKEKKELRVKEEAFIKAETARIAEEKSVRRQLEKAAKKYHFTMPEIEKDTTVQDILLRQDPLTGHPGRAFLRYANKRTGLLPPILKDTPGVYGTDMKKILARKKMKSLEEAQQAVNDYISKSKMLAELYEDKFNPIQAVHDLDVVSTPIFQTEQDRLNTYPSAKPFETMLKEEHNTPLNKRVGFLDRWLRTPDRVFQKIGLGDEIQVVKKQYRGYLKELPQNIDKISNWAKSLPKEIDGKPVSQRIYDYLNGANVDENGFLKPDFLTAQEKQVADAIKVWLKQWADRLHIPEDERISNYITRIFSDELIKKEFDEDLAKIIADKVAGEVYDPFLQERLGALGYKRDVWAALDAYVKRATRKVYMDPALEMVKIAANTLDVRTFDYVKEYIDRVNLRPTKLDSDIDTSIKQLFGYKLGARPIANITRGFRKIIYRGTLGLNIGSAIKNLTQGVNTYAMLGEKYTLMGYIEAIKPLNYKELQDEGILGMDIIQDRSLSSTKKFWEKFDKGLFFFFETVEKINRASAYFGAKAKYYGENSKKVDGVTVLKEGYSEEDARDYARKIVEKTQFTFGSVDTPLALSSDIGKSLLQFQSFNIKQAEFMAEMAKTKNYAGMIRYIIASLVVYFSLRKIFKTKLTDFIPFARYGLPPIITVPKGLYDAAVGAPDDYGNTPSAKRRIANAIYSGTPLVPAGVQISKTIKGIQATKEGTTYDKIKGAIVGAPSKDQTRTPLDEAVTADNKKQKEQTQKTHDEFDRINKLPTDEEKANAFDELMNSDPKTAQGVLDLINEKELGITATDKKILSLGVENGARAQYIADQFNKLKTDEEKGALWEEYVTKKIITSTVAEQLGTLLNQQQ